MSYENLLKFQLGERRRRKKGNFFFFIFGWLLWHDRKQFSASLYISPESLLYKKILNQFRAHLIIDIYVSNLKKKKNIDCKTWSLGKG